MRLLLITTHQDLGIVFPKTKMIRNAEDTVLKEVRMETEDAVYAEHIASKQIKGKSLDDLVSLPASRLHVRKVLCRMRLLWVSVFAHVWVRVFLLVEVTEGMVNFSMLGFICAD
jgi:hypothetical protein